MFCIVDMILGFAFMFVLIIIVYCLSGCFNEPHLVVWCFAFDCVSFWVGHLYYLFCFVVWFLFAVFCGLSVCWLLLRFFCLFCFCLIFICLVSFADLFGDFVWVCLYCLIRFLLHMVLSRCMFGLYCCSVGFLLVFTVVFYGAFSLQMLILCCTCCFVLFGWIDCFCLVFSLFVVVIIAVVFCFGFDRFLFDVICLFVVALVLIVSCLCFLFSGLHLCFLLFCCLLLVLVF